MTTQAQARATTQVFDIYIDAPAEKVWQHITDPQWNSKYGYRCAMNYDLRPGGSYRVHANAEMRAMGLPDLIIDGEVIECDPPRKLVQTYRWLFTEQTQAEGFTRLTWEVAPTEGGFTRLTVVHELEGAPGMAEMVKSRFTLQGGGGWNWILSDLKSLIETGKTMGGAG